MKNALLISLLLIPFIAIAAYDSTQKVAVSYSICNAAESSGANKEGGTYLPLIVRLNTPVFEGSSHTQEKIVVCWTEGGVEKTHYWMSENVIFVDDDTALVSYVTFFKKPTSANTTFFGKETDEGFVSENGNDTATIHWSSEQRNSIFTQEEPDVRVQAG